MMPKILVIDDDLGILKLVQHTLDRAGFLTIITDNGLDAVDMAALHHPQVVLLDDSLPAFSAQQVARDLRANTQTSHIPIIIFSSSTYNNPAYVQALGGDAMIAKPFLPNELVACLKSWVQPCP